MNSITHKDLQKMLLEKAGAKYNSLPKWAMAMIGADPIYYISNMILSSGTEDFVGLITAYTDVIERLSAVAMIAARGEAIKDAKKSEGAI